MNIPYPYRKRPASPARRMGIPVPSPLSSGEKVAARPDEGFCPPSWQKKPICGKNSPKAGSVGLH